MEYQVDLTEYLAKCINKSKPQLQCKGKCALRKKIKEKEEKEASKDQVAFVYSAFYLHKEYSVFTMYQPKEVSIEDHFLPYLIDYRFEYNTAVFRPPIS
jgi:hypothetical protein